jgi:hypothetical protein
MRARWLAGVGLLGTVALAAGAGGQPIDPPAPMHRPGTVPDAVAATLTEVRSQSLPDRITAVSGLFLGAPYVLDALGDGAGRDADPLARYDAFDCQTYVEEVLALALSTDAAEAGALRRAIRYGADAPAFSTRRHFTELQWLPRVLADGFLADTTRDYGAATREIRMAVPRSLITDWKAGERFHDPATLDNIFRDGDPATLAITIVPTAEAIGIAPQIRPGSVVLFVRGEKPGLPLRTSHMGLVLAKGTLRHASQAGKRVMDEPLDAYLKNASTWTSWPLDGIAILEPRERWPRG